ncbi:hypothetical protein BD779DRAFT_510448 [Infundibulicybe gibba]|nr:hypothetical protein BD779DRAFT_510448 [Infundibulicybe gibba]
MPSSKPKHQLGATDPAPPLKPSYLIRIHRPDDTYHVVSLEWDVGVTKLIAAFGQKLGLSREEVVAHRLFIQERGAERVLLPTERPARIIQGRLQEAGYDNRDSRSFYQAKTRLSCLSLLSRTIRRLVGPTSHSPISKTLASQVHIGAPSQKR